MAQAANNAAITSIAAPTGAVGDDVTHISLWTVETGGSLLQWTLIDSSENPDPLALGDTYVLAIGALVIESDVVTNMTETMAQRSATGKVAGGVWIQYHTGSPGVNGTANVITDLGRAQVTQAQFTIT